MANKIFGSEFDNDTSPLSTWTISANNGTVLKDVTLVDILKVFAQISSESSPANADTLLMFDSSASAIKQLLLTDLYKGIFTNGWITSEETWSYSSADSPTFIASVNADMTGKISVGYRVRLTQTTTKYFIVTSVGTFSGGATLITLYGGTDYTLANAAITTPYYSSMKVPYGFPISEDKWTVTTTDSSDRTQSSPVTNTWYNPGSLTISIPIGSWRVTYKCLQRVSRAAATTTNMVTTLSTANNSESDPDFTSFETLGGASGTLTLLTTQTCTPKILTIASKTSYFLNCRTTAGADSIGHRGDSGTTVIKAICAYL